MKSQYILTRPRKLLSTECVPFSASPLPTSLPPSTPSIARAYAVGKHQSLQTSPGVYHEPLFAGLDWVIQQAGLRGIYLTLVFTDYWEYNGGLSQYLDWSGSIAPSKNSFFSDPRSKGMYKANVKKIIERVNVYTGVAYKVG
jgi:mannan endo-1,4-beta-mannosidase